MISILLEQKQNHKSIRIAVRLMKQLYGIDMEKSQYSKTIDKIPTPDIAISMGCDVGCPYIGRAFDDNWGLPDPTGQGDEIFKYVIMQIEKRLNELKNYFCTSNDGLQSESD